MPVVYGSVVLGMLAVWRPPPPASPAHGRSESVDKSGAAGAGAAERGGGGGGSWTGKERAQLDSIARTLALALALDQVRGGSGGWWACGGGVGEGGREKGGREKGGGEGGVRAGPGLIGGPVAYSCGRGRHAVPIKPSS